jgi:hypothetical protein
MEAAPPSPWRWRQGWLLVLLLVLVTAAIAVATACALTPAAGHMAGPANGEADGEASGSRGYLPQPDTASDTTAIVYPTVPPGSLTSGLFPRANMALFTPLQVAAARGGAGNYNNEQNGDRQAFATTDQICFWDDDHTFVSGDATGPPAAIAAGQLPDNVSEYGCSYSWAWRSFDHDDPTNLTLQQLMCPWVPLLNDGAGGYDCNNVDFVDWAQVFNSGSTCQRNIFGTSLATMWQAQCVKDGWNPVYLYDCCMGNVDTAHPPSLTSGGTVVPNLVAAATCDPTWYPDSQFCNFSLMEACGGSASDGRHHFASPASQCAQWFENVQEWERLGQTTSATGLIAAEVVRYCEHEGAGTADCLHWEGLPPVP